MQVAFYQVPMRSRQFGLSSKYIDEIENISKPSFLLVTNFRRDFVKLQRIIYSAYPVVGVWGLGGCWRERERETAL